MGKVRVLLDTNIVLDFFSGRMGDSLAEKLVQIGRSGQFEMCISFLTAVNTMYVIRKYGVSATSSDIPQLFTILPQDSQQWEDASGLGMNDFEDALQTSCALHNGCFVAISRDRHFDCAPMSVMTPEHFLATVCPEALTR